jgi:phosphomannomutase
VAMRMTHNIHPGLLRAYDLRGRVDTELTCDDAAAVGLAFASFASARGLKRIAVLRDGRLSSPRLTRALIRGLLAAGAQVYPLGIGPTPLLHFAVRAAALDGGIMVTGSHNPPDQNGFKLLLAGEPIYGAELRRLIQTAPVRCLGGRLRKLAAVATDASPSEATLAGAYVGNLAGVLGEGSAGLREDLHVVWDCGHGAVAAVLSKLTARLPGRHTLLNCRVDGRFPAHHPDPAVGANLAELCRCVREERADLGFAFDGDGDRLGVVDAQGEILWADQVLALLASDVLREHPGATIVADVKSSRILFERIRALGGHAVMAPSGYVLVRAAMLECGAMLAGEMSGHILFRDCWHRTDDALFAAMRVLRAVARLGCTLAGFRSGLPRTVATPELRIPCEPVRKHAIIREVARRIRRSPGVELDVTDGLRVTTSDGWWLLRASGTEAKLTARCEAGDERGLQTLLQELAGQLFRSGVELTDRGA